MMSTLFELSEDYAHLYDALDSIDLDDEGAENILTAYFDTLEGIEGELNMKLENIALFIKQLAYDASAIKIEKDNLAKRQKQKEHKLDQLKRYVSDCMQKTGLKKLETPKCSISFRKSTEINVANESLLPTEYITVTEQRKPDKKAIKKALNDGWKINGASLVEKQNIQIK